MKLVRSMMMALVIAAAVRSPTATAQTIGYAEAADRLAVACGADIDRFCKGVNIGSGRIGACLRQNDAKLSPKCRVTQIEVFRLLERRAAAQAAVMKLCDADARRLCAGVQMGDGNILHCILAAQKVVSVRCNQAITDAGYR